MMKLCDDVITIFNKHVEDGQYTYIPTVINGVSWYATIATTVNDGLVAANKFVIRIPVDADFSGKEYVDSTEYGKLSSVEGVFTIANGDIIIKDALAVAPMTPAEMKANYQNYCTVLGVTDNRRAPNAPHFRVVGS